MSDESEFAVTRHPSPVSPDQRAALLEAPGFGQVFTDHMATIGWSEGRGWHSHRIGPRVPFSIDPACAVLHYAQEIFEGMKAYPTHAGLAALFRPWENARRFARSAERMAMPPLPESLFLSAVEALIKADRDWIPEDEGTLYLRPFMFASEAFLGVRPAREYTFCVIASPVGAYFRGDTRRSHCGFRTDSAGPQPGGPAPPNAAEITRAALWRKPRPFAMAAIRWSFSTPPNIASSRNSAG